MLDIIKVARTHERGGDVANAVATETLDLVISAFSSYSQIERILKLNFCIRTGVLRHAMSLCG